MQPLDHEIVSTIWNGTDAEILARVYGRDANRNKVLLTAAEVASVTWSNTHGVTGAAIGSGTFVVADVMLPAVSHGTIWEADKRGFNFHAVLAGANLQQTTNLVLVTVTGTSGRRGSFLARIKVA